MEEKFFECRTERERGKENVRMVGAKKFAVNVLYKHRKRQLPLKSPK